MKRQTYLQFFSPLLRFIAIGLVMPLGLSGCVVLDIFYDKTDARVRLDTPGVEGAECVVHMPHGREVRVVTPGIFKGSRQGPYHLNVSCKKACYIDEDIRMWMPHAVSSSGNYYAPIYGALLAHYLPQVTVFLQPEKICLIAPPFSSNSYIKEGKDKNSDAPVILFPSLSSPNV